MGIKGNTALIQTAAGYKVLGSGGVAVWNGAGQTRYTAGPPLSWKNNV